MSIKRFARVDRNNPEAMGQCDRGAHVVPYRELKKEMVYRGDDLVWNGLLVCARHLDKPNEQDRPKRPRPEVPIRDPRPEK